MGWRPSSLLPLILLYLAALIDTSSDTVVSGRCHQKCASQFTKMTVRIRNDRSVANEPLTNSTEFVFCKLGCLRVPGFDEHHHASFHKGRRLRAEIDDTATEATGRTVPEVLNGVDFLCAHSSPMNSTRLNVSVALNLAPENSRLMDYHVEVFGRSSEASKEQLMYTTHIFSALVTIPLELEDDVAELQVRAAAYDSMGLVGQSVKSRWWPVATIRDTADVPLKMTIQRQMWHEERAAALLAIDWPLYRIPPCKLRLKVARPEQTHSHEEIPVLLDETRVAMASRLHYEETYAIEVDEIMPSPRSPLTSSASSTAVIVVTVEPCLTMVADANMCPPPPVSSLSYKWNSTDTFVVNWNFAQPPADDRRPSHHFLVTVSLQPKRERKGREEAGKGEKKEEEDEEGVRLCEQRINHIRRTYTAEVRSATFRLPPASQQCAFAVEVMAVDARNRRSRGVMIDSRQAEQESWQAVESGGVEIALLWALFLVMCVTGVAISLMVLRHQQRSSKKKSQMKEREHHREILDSLYGRDTLGRYAPAPSAIHTFLTAPSPPLTEVPRGVYRAGRGGWSTPSTTTAGDNNTTLKEASYSSRLIADDGYAICELHDETADCQHNLSLFPLPPADRQLYGVPVYSPEDYDMVELVGRGRFGDVFAARFIQSTTITAIKHFTDSTDLQTEFAAARSLCLTRSPFFPSLVGVVCPRDSLALSALVYEFCPGGDLRSFLLTVREELPQRAHLAKSLRVVAPRIFCFLRATAASLAELHSRSVVHRDISARNVLLTARWNDSLEMNEGCEAKLADIGLCSRIDGEEGARRLSLPWQSPQVRTGARYTLEDDVWSFGCLLLEVATLGCEPWSGGGPLPVVESGREIARYVETIGVGHAKIDAALACRLRQLIADCLSIDRMARPSIRRIIDYLIGLNTGGTIQTTDLHYYSKDSQFV